MQLRLKTTATTNALFEILQSTKRPLVTPLNNICESAYFWKIQTENQRNDSLLKNFHDGNLITKCRCKFRKLNLFKKEF